MEAHMELSKKTTILLSPQLHGRLTYIAEERGVSLGELIRSACEEKYGLVSTADRVAAVQALAALELPVADPGTMKKQSVPDPDELLP
jgi:hypothetical protein